MNRDCYEVLGLARNASDKEIKKAFRSLARELHPDVNSKDPDAESKFKEAAEAYEVLSNPETRATYDRYGFDGLKRGGFQDFSQFSFDDIIRSFFGDAVFGEDMFGMGRTASRGEDIGVAVELTLAEAASGVTREVEFDVVAACETCEGSGAEPGTDRETCQTCNGVGQVRTVTSTAFGQFMRTGACGTCGGIGSIAASPCTSCNGSGLAIASRKIEVEIPPGIAEGQSIRMPGRGSMGGIGSQPGDLFVQVSVAAHDALIRDGDDLVYHLQLTMVEAAAGNKTIVTTLEGDEEIEVKAGAQFGEVIILKGRGMPSLRGRGRGDLRIIIDIIIPRHLTPEQKEMLQEFEDTTSEKNYAGDSGSLFSRIKAAFR
jgi:molecular chaperone DnaJ